MEVFDNFWDNFFLVHFPGWLPWQCSSSLPLPCTTCVTILLYGCESWIISKDMENKINSFGTSCYRIMLNIKRIDKVPNVTIYNLTETVPLVERARFVNWNSLNMYCACLMGSLSRSMHCMSQNMERGNLEGKEPCSQNTSTVFWEMQMACWIMVNCQKWLKTVVAGGNLWSTAA